MHDNDVGSPVPGSFVAGASNRFDEAPLFPAVKLVENYKIRHDIERIKLRNCRTPELNALNMRARVAALRTTEQRLGDLIAQYGIDTFLAAQEGIIDYVGRVVRQRLRDIPDGSWFAQGYLDHDGRTAEHLPDLLPGDQARRAADRRLHRHLAAGVGRRSTAPARPWRAR